MINRGSPLEGGLKADDVSLPVPVRTGSHDLARIIVNVQSEDELLARTPGISRINGDSPFQVSAGKMLLNPAVLDHRSAR